MTLNSIYHFNTSTYYRYTSSLETVSVNYNCHTVDYFDLYKTLLQQVPFDSRKYTEVQKCFSWHCVKCISRHCVRCISSLFCSPSFLLPHWKAKTLFYRFLPTKHYHYLLYAVGCIFLSGKISMGLDAYQYYQYSLTKITLPLIHSGVYSNPALQQSRK